MTSWFRRLSLLQWLLAAIPLAVVAAIGLASNPGTPWQSVSGLCFSPDGKQLAIGVYTGRFRRFRDRWYFADVAHTVAIGIPGQEPAPRVLGTDQRVGTFNMLPEVFIGSSVAFSADGKTLASAAFNVPSSNGGFDLWDVSSGRLLARQATRFPHVRTFALLPGRDLLLAGFRYWVLMWDFGSGSLANELEVGMNIQTIAPAPTGWQIAVGGLAAPEIEIWDLKKKTLIDHLTLSENPSLGVRAMTYTPDGKTLVIADDESLLFVDAAARKIVARVPERLVLALAISPDGKRLATGRYDGVTLWDLSNRTKTGMHGELAAAESVQFSPDGRLLAVGAADGSVHAWNAANGELIWSWKHPTPHTAEILRLLATATLCAWGAGWLIYGFRRQFSNHSLLS